MASESGRGAGTASAGWRWARGRRAIAVVGVVLVCAAGTAGMAGGAQDAERDEVREEGTGTEGGPVEGEGGRGPLDADPPVEVEIEPRGGGVDATELSGLNQVPVRTASRVFGASSTRLVPEGMLLVERRGRVHRLATGRAVFVFDADASGQADPPMFLMPSVRTMQLERLIEERGAATTVRLTGAVTAYKGWNYLRVSNFQVLQAVPEGMGGTGGAGGTADGWDGAGADGGEEAGAESEAGGGAPDVLAPEFGEIPVRTPDGSERSVGDVLAELESRGPDETGFAPPPVVEIEDARGVLAEGRVLVSRRGRILPHPGGGLQFEFDNGPEDPPGLDQPLILLPCLMLERIEEAVSQRRSGGVTLSGQVFGYGDHAFLLPTMFVLERVRSENIVTAQ
ncbi:MAG: hypothetical protein ACTS3F_01495 [Phycisphaerales bacterium]